MSSTLFTRPAEHALRGTLQVPGDKSVSHRALIFAALAEGCSEIEGLLRGDDVLATWRAVEQLGAVISEAGTLVRVEGVGGKGLSAPKAALDMGNSGTAMRLLAGVLAAQAFDSVLVGDASLNSRPMRRIIGPLTAMGGRIEPTGQGTAPLRIFGRRLHGIEYASPIASAQVKSCVLLAGLYAQGRTRVTEPTPSRDHTERMLSAFGAPLDPAGFVHGGSRLRACPVRVPADISSAAFPMAAALLVPGSEIRLTQVGLNPTRDGLIRALQSMGAGLRIVPNPDDGGEPTGTLHVRYAGRLRGIDLDPGLVPSMVDEIPVLMALAACADGTTRIRGAEELRFKESDRLEVMGTALRELGVEVRLYPDGADIVGRTDLHAQGLDSAGDHRCAMSLAVLGLVSERGLEISQAEYIRTSYPGFAEDMRNLGAPIQVSETGTGIAKHRAGGEIPVIAIDGPVGSGKGTISARLAERLGWHYLDSGALYRLVALCAMNHGVSPADEEQLAALARGLDFDFRHAGSSIMVLLEGIDVTARIRQEDVSAMASRVAAIGAVRSAMVHRQRAFVRAPGLVADGRDMGTVIFPAASLKIFLTASVEVRANRRHKQLKDKGESVNLSRLFREIEARDRRDMERPVAPLRAADDAVVIDSSDSSINEVLDRIYFLVKEKHLT